MTIGNQPAFPAEADGGYGPAPGMTYRQWLIGMALQGIIAADHENALTEKACANGAILCADAVLSRLDSEGKQ